MAEQLWTIIRIATGEVLCPAYVTPSVGSHPKDNGWAWDATKQTATRIPARPDLAVQVFTSGAWAEDAAKVEALLVAQVKQKGADLVSGIYTTVFGKQKKYSRKQQEVLDFRDLGGLLGATIPNALSTALTAFVPAFSALTATQQRKKFRFAMAEAQLRGVSIDVVIGEFEAAIDTIEAKVASWEAIEQVGIRAIKAATTAASKRAAYAAINWNWTAG